MPIAEPPSLLMRQFLAWIADRPRSYAETMAAWRTHCPRQSIWEDANADGLVDCDGTTVVLTEAGRELMAEP